MGFIAIPLLVPVRVLTLCSPTHVPPVWHMHWDKIEDEEIRSAAARGDTEDNPYTDGGGVCDHGYTWTRQTHIDRIAYLAENPDEWEPIELTNRADWPVYDGHHRLAAAVYLGIESVKCFISSVMEPGTPHLFSKYELPRQESHAV